MVVAHFAFQLGLRHQGGDTVDDQHVDGPGADQGVGDFQRLFAAIGLRNQQVFGIDAQFFGVNRVERVFGIDKGAGAAQFLGLGHPMQGQGRLARAFRAVDLDHPAAWQAADAERDIKVDGTGRENFRLHHFALTKTHNRALAESAFDLRDRRFQGLVLVCVIFFFVFFHEAQRSFRHNDPFLISHVSHWFNACCSRKSACFVLIGKDFL